MYDPQSYVATGFQKHLVWDNAVWSVAALTIGLAVLPVIAAVHGRALAGGCGLATACDLVIATRTARFGYPEVKIGFVPAMVAAILKRNLGEKKCFELLTQGFEFSAEEANAIGLVNAIFEDEAFDVAAIEYASRYAHVSGSAVAMTKRLLYDIDGLSFAEALRMGIETNARARQTEDCKAGIAKFLETQTSRNL